MFEDIDSILNSLGAEYGGGAQPDPLADLAATYGVPSDPPTKPKKPKKVPATSSTEDSDQARYNRFVAELKKEGVPITSGYRTREQQSRLFNRLPKGQAARPGTSDHEFWRAIDTGADVDEAKIRRAAERAGVQLGPHKIHKGTGWHRHQTFNKPDQKKPDQAAGSIFPIGLPDDPVATLTSGSPDDLPLYPNRRGPGDPSLYPQRLGQMAQDEAQAQLEAVGQRAIQAASGDKPEIDDRGLLRLPQKPAAEQQPMRLDGPEAAQAAYQEFLRQTGLKPGLDSLKEFNTVQETLGKMGLPTREEAQAWLDQSAAQQRQAPQVGEQGLLQLSDTGPMAQRLPATWQTVGKPKTDAELDKTHARYRVDLQNVRGNKAEYALKAVRNRLMREYGIDAATAEGIAGSFTSDITDKDPYIIANIPRGDIASVVGRDAMKAQYDRERAEIELEMLPGYQAAAEKQQRDLAAGRSSPLALPGFESMTQAERNIARDPFARGTQKEINAEQRRLNAVTPTTAEQQEFIRNADEYVGPGTGSALLAGITGAMGRTIQALAGVMRFGIGNMSKGHVGEAVYPDWLNALTKEGIMTENYEAYWGRQNPGALNTALRVTGGVAGDIPRYLLMTRLPGGMPVLFAGDEYVRSVGRGERWDDQVKAVGRGAALGAIFQGAGKLATAVEGWTARAINNPLFPNLAKGSPRTPNAEAFLKDLPLEARRAFHNLGGMAAVSATPAERLAIKLFGGGARIGTIGTGAATAARLEDDGTTQYDADGNVVSSPTGRALEAGMVMALTDIAMRGATSINLDSLIGKIFRGSKDGRTIHVTVEPDGSVRLLKGQVGDKFVDMDMVFDPVSKTYKAQDPFRGQPKQLPGDHYQPKWKDAPDVDAGQTPKKPRPPKPPSPQGKARQQQRDREVAQQNKEWERMQNEAASRAREEQRQAATAAESAATPTAPATSEADQGPPEGSQIQVVDRQGQQRDATVVAVRPASDGRPMTLVEFSDGKIQIVSPEQILKQPQAAAPASGNAGPTRETPASPGTPTTQTNVEAPSFTKGSRVVYRDDEGQEHAGTIAGVGSQGDVFEVTLDGAPGRPILAGARTLSPQTEASPDVAETEEIDFGIDLDDDYVALSAEEGGPRRLRLGDAVVTADGKRGDIIQFRGDQLGGTEALVRVRGEDGKEAFHVVPQKDLTSTEDELYTGDKVTATAGGQLRPGRIDALDLERGRARVVYDDGGSDVLPLRNLIPGGRDVDDSQGYEIFSETESFGTAKSLATAQQVADAHARFVPLDSHIFVRAKADQDRYQQALSQLPADADPSSLRDIPPPMDVYSLPGTSKIQKHGHVEIPLITADLPYQKNVALQQPTATAVIELNKLGVDTVSSGWHTGLQKWAIIAYKPDAETLQVLQQLGQRVGIAVEDHFKLPEMMILSVPGAKVGFQQKVEAAFGRFVAGIQTMQEIAASEAAQAERDEAVKKEAAGKPAARKKLFTPLKQGHAVQAVAKGGKQVFGRIVAINKDKALVDFMIRAERIRKEVPLKALQPVSHIFRVDEMVVVPDSQGADRPARILELDYNSPDYPKAMVEFAHETTQPIAIREIRELLPMPGQADVAMSAEDDGGNGSPQLAGADDEAPFAISYRGRDLREEGFAYPAVLDNIARRIQAGMDKTAAIDEAIEDMAKYQAAFTPRLSALDGEMEMLQELKADPDALQVRPRAGQVQELDTDVFMSAEDDGGNGGPVADDEYLGPVPGEPDPLDSPIKGARYEHLTGELSDAIHAGRKGKVDVMASLLEQAIGRARGIERREQLDLNPSIAALKAALSELRRTGKAGNPVFQVEQILTRLGGTVEKTRPDLFREAAPKVRYKGVRLGDEWYDPLTLVSPERSAVEDVAIMLHQDPGASIEQAIAGVRQQYQDELAGASQSQYQGQWRDMIEAVDALNPADFQMEPQVQELDTDVFMSAEEGGSDMHPLMRSMAARRGETGRLSGNISAPFKQLPDVVDQVPLIPEAGDFGWIKYQMSQFLLDRENEGLLEETAAALLGEDDVVFQKIAGDYKDRQDVLAAIMDVLAQQQGADRSSQMTPEQWDQATVDNMGILPHDVTDAMMAAGLATSEWHRNMLDFIEDPDLVAHLEAVSKGAPLDLKKVRKIGERYGKTPTNPNGLSPTIVERALARTISGRFPSDAVRRSAERAAKRARKPSESEGDPALSGEGQEYLDKLRGGVGRPDTDPIDDVYFSAEDEADLITPTEMIEIKQGQVSTDMKVMLALLGEHMYKAGLFDTVLKETMQNSMDAVRQAQAEGLTDDPRIRLTMLSDQRLFIIEDNGVGMDYDTVLGAYMRLGGSQKGAVASGGLGMAKAAFLFGSERVEVETIKDGVKLNFTVTPDKVDGSPVEISQSYTSEPNGTRQYIYFPKEVTSSIGTREISIPRMVGSASFFGQPMLGDVTVESYSAFEDSWRTDGTPTTREELEALDETARNDLYSPEPIGRHFPLDRKYDKLTHVTFSWGEADVYVGKERNSWPSQVILSNGLYQFEDRFQIDRDTRVPFDIIVNVQPGRKATDPDYPFTLNRENWRHTIKPDIDALHTYVARLGAADAALEHLNAFKDLRQLPLVPPGPVSEEDAVRASQAILAEPDITPPSMDIMDYITIDNGQVVQVDRGGLSTVSPLDEQAGKVAAQSMRADAIIGDPMRAAAQDFWLDPQQPIYHNNINKEWISLAQQNDWGDAGAFFLEISNAVWAASRAIATMRKMENESPMFAEGVDGVLNEHFFGVSMSKGYFGVTVHSPFKGVFLNPLAVHEVAHQHGQPSLSLVATKFVDTIYHEMAHMGHQSYGDGHDASFVSRYAALMLMGGKYNVTRTLVGTFTDILSRHENVWRSMVDAYEQEDATNIERPRGVHEGEWGANTGGSALTGRPQQGDVPSQEQQDGGSNVRRSPEPVKPGDIAAAVERASQRYLNIEKARQDLVSDRAKATADPSEPHIANSSSALGGVLNSYRGLRVSALAMRSAARVDGDALRVNAPGQELIRRALEWAFSDRGKTYGNFSGQYASPYIAGRVAEALDEMAQAEGLSGNGMGAANIRKFAQQYRKAMSPVYRDQVILVDLPAHLAERQKAIEAEEYAHRADHRLRQWISFDNVAYFALQGYRTAWAILREMSGYAKAPDHVLHNEIIAKIFRPDALERLEISEAERDAIERAYLKQLLEEGIPPQAIVYFFEGVDSAYAKRFRETAQIIHEAQNRAVQRALVKATGPPGATGPPNQRGAATGSLAAPALSSGGGGSFDGGGRRPVVGGSAPEEGADPAFSIEDDSPERRSMMEAVDDFIMRHAPDFITKGDRESGVAFWSNGVRAGMLAGVSAIKTNMYGNPLNIVTEEVSHVIASSMAWGLRGVTGNQDIQISTRVPSDYAAALVNVVTEGFFGTEPYKGGVIQALREGVGETPEAARHNLDDPLKTEADVGKGLEQLQNMPTVLKAPYILARIMQEAVKRLFIAIDRPFSAFSRGAEMHAQTRKAAHALREAGVEGNWKELMELAAKEIGPTAEQLAIHAGQVATFQNPNVVTDAAELLRSKLTTGDIFTGKDASPAKQAKAQLVGQAVYVGLASEVPFVRTVSNIGIRTAEYFPPFAALKGALMLRAAGNEATPAAEEAGWGSRLLDQAQRADDLWELERSWAREDAKIKGKRRREDSIRNKPLADLMKEIDKQVAASELKKKQSDAAIRASDLSASKKLAALTKNAEKYAEMLKRAEAARSDVRKQKAREADKVKAERKQEDAARAEARKKEYEQRVDFHSKREYHDALMVLGRGGLGALMAVPFFYGLIQGLIWALGDIDYDDERNKWEKARKAGIPEGSIKVPEWVPGMGGYRWPLHLSPATRMLGIYATAYDQANRPGSGTEKAAAVADAMWGRGVLTLNPYTDPTFSDNASLGNLEYVGKKALQFTPFLNARILQEAGEVLDDKPRTTFNEGFFGPFNKQLPPGLEYVGRDVLPEPNHPMAGRGDAWRRAQRLFLEPPRGNPEWRSQATLPNKSLTKKKK